MMDALIKVARTLNEGKILWGIGGSLLLKVYGLVEEVHDMDIIVAEPDLDKALALLDTIGDRADIPIKKEYVTRHFIVYNIDGVDMDVMSGFRIKHNRGIYEYPMDTQSVTRIETIEGVALPYLSLEDWFLAYRLMIGRDKKVGLIRQYLIDQGIEYPDLLKRLLDQTLPEDIEAEIRQLLS